MSTSQPVQPQPTAADRWAEARRGWVIPQEILDAAPEPPPGFDVVQFVRAAARALGEETPSRRAARDALPDGGVVLDVGCGAGAAGLPLAPPAARLMGVDADADMLAAFAEGADARGIAHHEINGRWPDVADQAPPADVVVCHSVFYGISDLVPFVRELTAHARARVVVQLPERPPRSWLRPYWQALHGVTLPDGPTADDAAAVVREAGFDVHAERWDRPMRGESGLGDRVESLRRRLCVGAGRDAEIRQLLERHPPPATGRTVTLWWSPWPR